MVTVTTTVSAGQPYRPDEYRWTFYYEAMCKTNCHNTGKFWQWKWSTPWYKDDATCKAGPVNNPYTDPPAMRLPSAGTCSDPASGTSWKNASSQGVWVPYAQGPWNTPLDAEYKYQGNNYNLSTDTSCDAANGGKVLVDVGSGTQAEIKNYLGTGADLTKELHAANASTPLAGALDTALTYFTDPDGVVMTDSNKTCRKNFVLLITDGGEACLIDLTVPGQKAAALANLTDPAGGVQTYVVGLDQGGLSPDAKKVPDDIASQGGTFNYSKASDTTSLTNALNTILGEILSTNYSFASIIVPACASRTT